MEFWKGSKSWGMGRKTLFGMALFLMMGMTSSKAEVIADATVATDYIYRGLDNLNGGPAFQPTVTWITGTGIDLNAWFNWGLTNRGSQAIRNFDEVDLTASYTKQLGSFLVQGGLFHLSWYNFPTFPDDYSQFNEVFIGVSHLGLPFQPSVTVNYELNEVDGNDLYIQARMGHEVMFDNDMPVFFGLSAGYYQAEWMAMDGISDINLEVGTTVSKGLHALTPSIKMTYVPRDEVNPNHLVIWGSLTLTRVWLAGS